MCKLDCDYLPARHIKGINLQKGAAKGCMTYIHSLRLTGETAETHAWSGGELCGYVWDAGIVPSGKIPILLTFLSLCMSKSVLDPVDILPPFLGMGKGSSVCRISGCAGICQAKLFVSS